MLAEIEPARQGDLPQQWTTPPSSDGVEAHVALWRDHDRAGVLLGLEQVNLRDGVELDIV